MGNIFGWRISLIGLVVLLLFLGMIVYRHYTMGVPPGLELQDQPSPVVDPDTLETGKG